MKVSYSRTEHFTVDLREEEIKKIIVDYITQTIMDGNHINKDGLLEHWTSWPHGSGTTTIHTIHGEPSELQKTAHRFKILLTTIK